MKERVLSASQVQGRKTLDYVCKCCEEPFISGRSKEESLCPECVQIRRILRVYGKRMGVDARILMARVEKLLGSEDET